MKMYSLVMGVIFAIFSAGAFSYPWVHDTKINRVQIVNDGGFLLYLNKDARPACTSVGTKVLYFYADKAGVSSDGIKAMLSGAMLAYASGKTIDIQYDDSHPHCWGRHITLK